MSALRIVSIVLGLQAAVAAGAIGAALYERHEQHVACGKPALITTVVGYTLWKVQDCGPGGSPVYMMTPPVVGETPSAGDRERAI